MDFYRSISAEYDLIFPLNADQLNFIIKKLGPPDKRKPLLDIGCGTASLIIALSEKGYDCVGVDSNQEMIRMANSKAQKLHSPPKIIPLEMLEINKQLEGDFGAMACLGNTLVHLQTKKQIHSFLKQCRKKLSRQGKLIIQIINYDRIYQMGIDQLPTIENDRIRFKRSYKRHSQRVDFITTLTLKNTGKVISNKVPLFPLFQKELQEILMASGFDKLEYFGNFKGAYYDENSYALIVVAE